MGETKRVVLFGIDGAGTFFEQAQTPHMDRLFSGGAVCLKVLTEMPSISAQCWGSMLHGVECGWHGLTNAIADTTPYPGDAPWPSVFRLIREARPQAKLASFCDWASINIGIIEDDLDVFKHNAPDRELIAPACRYVEENDFTLLFFQFDSVDHAGHEYGYGTPEHLEAIRICDGYIGAVAEALARSGKLEDTLLLVEADHGGTPNYGYGGEHGGATDAERFVSFFAKGPGICQGSFKDMLVRDTPAVITHALGIPMSPGWTAKVPAGLFLDLPEGTEAGPGLPPARQVMEDISRPEDGSLLRSFAHLEPKLYLPFESDGEFPADTQAHGKLYRVAGLRGSAMGFQDGWLSMPAPDMRGDWTICFWVKPRLPHGEGVATVLALGDSCHQLPEGMGSVIQLGDRFLRVIHKGPWKESFAYIDMTLPADTSGKWLFVTVVRDRTRERVGLSVDFAPLSRWWDGTMKIFEEGTMYIGRDALGLTEDRLPAILDDLCIFGKALDDRDLEQLKHHHGL